MRWKSHVRFGRRAAETDRSRDRHRAAARPHTEHRTVEGKLYLCAIKDVYSGRIVGYSIDSRMKASLAVAALRNAIVRRSPVGTVVHSDRGSQPGLNRSSQHRPVLPSVGGHRVPRLGSSSPGFCAVCR